MGWAPRGYRRKIGRCGPLRSRRPHATVKRIQAKLKNNYRLDDGRIVKGEAMYKIKAAFCKGTATPLLVQFEQARGTSIKKHPGRPNVIIGEVL